MLAAAGLALPAYAVSTDPLIEGAKLCTRHLPRYEREYGIPVHLLSAIASTESGRWHEKLRIALPWPWTINAEGKGYYFDSKQEAVAAAKRLKSQGVRSMDVGCMQVNLHHHPNAFASLEVAFEPEHNVGYAASFLRNLYQEDKSWRAAAAAYHSKTPAFGSQYVSRVYDRWYNIIDRVRNARVNMASAVGGVAVGGGLTMAETRSAQEASQGKKPMPTPAISYASLNTQRPAAAVYHPARSIKVKNAPSASGTNARRENDILVIRPPQEVVVPPPASVAPAAVSSASASAPAPQATASSPASSPPAPKIVDARALAAAAPAAGAIVSGVASALPSTGALGLTAKAGPRFIFSD